MKDSANIFERVYNGMSALCGNGALSERLERVLQTIAPLRADEFPEAMRSDFITLQEGIIAARKPGTTDEDRERLSEDCLRLYTKAARLEGTLQNIVGGG